jgi:endonuclease/exonuclease/phosphatase family metal-dependent hydrolase
MSVKILNLNLFEGGLFFDAALDFIKAENPDVFCLQEVYNGQGEELPLSFQSIKVLTKAFPEYDYYFSPELLSVTPVGKIDVGNCIFSRLPILKSETHFFNIPYGEHPQKPANHDWSGHPKNMQLCQVGFQGKTLTVANLHGVWGLDGGDNPARLAMSQVIVDQVKNSSNLALMGDFNVKPNTQTIQQIEAHLVNVFKDELTTSFNLKHKDLDKYPGYASAVVDMFFVSPDVKVVAKSCPQADVSDHLPLICELSLS